MYDEEERLAQLMVGAVQEDRYTPLAAWKQQSSLLLCRMCKKQSEPDPLGEAV